MSVIANTLARLADLFDSTPYANRNLFVDPAKDLWNNSNAVALPIGGYGPNVLQILSSGTGGAGTYQRGVAAAGVFSRLGWPSGPSTFGTFSLTTASTGTLAARTGPVLAMRIEDVNTIEGRSITFSVVLNNQSAAPITITQLSAVQSFGVGGSPSANVPTLYPVNWVLPVDNVWRRFSARLDLPSAAGKTMGNTAGWTQIEIDLPVGQVMSSLQDCFWQAELCSPDAPAAGTPTAFEYRGAAAELQRIERYYEVQGAYYGSGAVNNATTAYCINRFRQQKRIAPTITPTAANTFALYNPTSGNSVPSAITFGATPDSYLATVTASGMTAGQGCFLQNNNGSSIIVDARL